MLLLVSGLFSDRNRMLHSSESGFAIAFNKCHCSTRWEFNSWCGGLEGKKPSVLHLAQQNRL